MAIKAADLDRIYSVTNLLNIAWKKTPHMSFMEFIQDLTLNMDVSDDELRTLLRNRIQDAHSRQPKTGRPGS